MLPLVVHQNRLNSLKETRVHVVKGGGGVTDVDNFVTRIIIMNARAFCLLASNFRFCCSALSCGLRALSVDVPTCSLQLVHVRSILQC